VSKRSNKNLNAVTALEHKLQQKLISVKSANLITELSILKDINFSKP